MAQLASMKHVFIIQSSTNGILSPVVPRSKSCSWSLCLLSVWHSSCWGWKGTQHQSVFSFWSGPSNQDQWIWDSKWASCFSSTAAKACCSARQPWSKSKWQTRLPFYPVHLRVQTDPLKRMHIKLNSQQPIWVRHLISARAHYQFNCLSNSKCVFPCRDCLSFHVVSLFLEAPTDTNHSNSHQLWRFVLVPLPKEFKF